MSCTLLAAVPRNGLEHSHRKTRLCVYFDVSQFPTSISVSTIILRLRKVEFIKLINATNVLFIGFVKFEKK